VEEKEEEHFGDGVSLSDIEAEWENIEEEQTVVTRASEKGDEERCTMMDGKEVQEEAREADEKDKVEEMKEKGETVDAEKTDVEEEKDKTGETVEAKKTWEEEKDKTGEMKDKGETVEAEKNDVEEEKEKTLKGKINFHISHSMLDCKYCNLPRGGVKRGRHVFDICLKNTAT